MRRLGPLVSLLELTHAMGASDHDIVARKPKMLRDGLLTRKPPHVPLFNSVPYQCDATLPTILITFATNATALASQRTFGKTGGRRGFKAPVEVKSAAALRQRRRD